MDAGWTSAIMDTAAAARAFVAAHPSAAAGYAAAAFCVVFTAASLGTFFVPWLLSFFCGVQDLKVKYGAEWAIVTGGTSGIGKAIARRLASQGLNVVIAAYDDKLMEESREAFPAEFPGCQFRFVPVDLSTADEQRYLTPLAAATSDIVVQVVFSNAGYIRTGLFDGSPLDVQLRNLRCNATSSAAVAHLFLRRMRRSGHKGCVVFTSSPANLTPCPLSAMYGATKSFLTELAVSVAPEVVEFGIDVAVLVSTATHGAAPCLLPPSPRAGPAAASPVPLRPLRLANARSTRPPLTRTSSTRPTLSGPCSSSSPRPRALTSSPSPPSASSAAASSWTRATTAP